MSLPRFDLSGLIEEGASTRVASFLAAHPGPVQVVVNSPGGIAIEGAAILAEFQNHGSVTATVRGVAASAASLAIMGAQVIEVHAAGLLMIHDPAAFAFGGTDELRRVADGLEKMTLTYAQAYASATGHPVSRIAAWMRAETWITADEALALNFCDRIEVEPAEPVMVAAFDYARFQNAPAPLVEMSRRKGWKQKPRSTTAKEKTDV